MRTAIDLSPLYRSIIGFDRLASQIDSAMQGDEDRAYPPYDIEKTGEDAYRITLAVAGFKPSDLEITTQPNLLVVKGGRAEGEQAEGAYLHRGIARRGFERRFELADYVVVKSAEHADGLLSIDLAREVPEALKPRRIEVQTRSGEPRLVDQKAKARAA
ncbi:Hsp20 family protein [Caulobacter sp. UC70_42]|uniref:Hsp20 family protein n=1 Tax=Caulobacter sp. UC70_42 TaxID=3374551 RepID=UPI00375718B7